MQHTAIIVAGGTGTRMGGNIPKQFLPLKGVPIIIHTLRKFWAANGRTEIVLVLHPDYSAEWEKIAGKYLLTVEKKHIRLCEGGTERIFSVENGLNCLSQLVGDRKDVLVAVHDAVRPFVSVEVIQKTFQIAEKQGAAIPCVAVKSSLRKIVSLENMETEAVDRADFLEVQTPQVFVFEELKACFDKREFDDFTDEASLYEEVSGKRVAIVEGSYDNIKITTPADLKN